MFLRRHTRTSAGKQLTYYTLVESVRTEAGPRQQVVAHLGELNSEQERRWHRTVTFYNRHCEANQLTLFPEDEAAPQTADAEVLGLRVVSVQWTSGSRLG